MSTANPETPTAKVAVLDTEFVLWEDGAALCPFCWDAICCEDAFVLIKINAPVKQKFVYGIAHTRCFNNAAAG